MSINSKRNRSPSYPVVDLESAIHRLDALYRSEGFNEALVDVVIELWGYNKGSGNGYRTISALIQYGLLEDRGSGDNRTVFLSEIGKTIAIDEREESSEKLQALQLAALNPSIFQKLWDKYNRSLPSDASIKYYLIKELNFNQNNVDRFIKIYRDTLDYAGFLKVEENISNSITEDIDPIVEEKPKTSNNEIEEPSNKSTDPEKLTIPIPLISGKQANLQIPIPLTNDDFNLIKNLIGTYLEGMKPAIVKEEER